jgi:hypothetical protein
MFDSITKIKLDRAFDELRQFGLTANHGKEKAEIDKEMRLHRSYGACWFTPGDQVAFCEGMSDFLPIQVAADIFLSDPIYSRTLLQVSGKVLETLLLFGLDATWDGQLGSSILLLKQEPTQAG